MATKYIVDSQFYSQSFNGAIFDGPIRLFFSQAQECYALELFHHLTHTYGDFQQDIRQLNKQFSRRVFLLMYPNLAEKCRRQPKGDKQKIFITPFKSTDYIIGFESQTVNQNPILLKPYLDFICDNWSKKPSDKVKNHFKENFIMHLN